MPKIAYILLCHKDPTSIIQQAELLTAAGDCVAIHFDARAANLDFKRIYKALSENPNVAFTKKRVKCGWGEWSLVEATLLAIDAALLKFEDATHFYMISGDCAPIKSAKYAHDFLATDDVDYIESVDFFEGNWIKTGMVRERLVYRHWFNERTQAKRFYWSLNLQQKFGLERRWPEDLEIQIGSQWWCLRRKTIESIRDYIRVRRDIVRFFRTTWIPDETFFQTMVRHLVPGPEIASRSLTFLMFSDYGLPVVLYNDHYDMLIGQSHLFARKVSGQATELRQRLGELYADKDHKFMIADNGRNLYEFHTTQGRFGRRFGGRFWENESSLGWNRELLIVVCKIWHIGKRFINVSESQKIGIPALHYVFNEDNARLPNLGGIEATLIKRGRHRRSLMRMLFEYYHVDRLVICLDPANIDILEDFAADRSKIRVLEISCDFSDAYLRGHTKRIGLAGDTTEESVIKKLLPMVRKELIHEHNRIRELQVDKIWTISTTASLEENTVQIAQFFDIPVRDARNIAKTPDLFDD